MFGRKKKKIEEKKEEPIRIFDIPQISKDAEGLKKEKDEFKNTPVFSAIWGRVVVDETVVPPTEPIKYSDRSLDAFRKPEDKKIPKDDDTDFSSVLITNKDRQRFFPGSKVVDPKPVEKHEEKKQEVGVPFDILSRRERKREVIKEHPKENIKEHVKEVKSDDFILNLDDNTIVGDPVYIDFYEEPIKIEENVPVIDDFVTVDFEDTPKKVVEKKVERKEIVRVKSAYGNYKLPPLSIFKKKEIDRYAKHEWIDEQIQIINNTLRQFDVDGSVVNYTKGPAITRYEISLKPGVNVKRVNAIEDNIKMNLAAVSLRIEAPIPGKATVGIEVPNVVVDEVAFGNVCHSDIFKNAPKLSFGVGIDINGETIVSNISKMPHGLIAGTTGSGKSVCVNTLIVSLLLKNTPEELKLMLIDPKFVEFTLYNDLPHLITPVITDPKIAAQGLKWAVEEMERRYRTFAEARERNIESYNKKIEAYEGEKKMPYIVIIIDELAELMMVASQDVESSIQRLTQKSRAAGIHLIVATQRPTTDVVKGTIKANIPTRIAFRVASYTDSITILDYGAAEMLLGRGDMFFKNEECTRRIQGAYISDDEIRAVCDFICGQCGIDDSHLPEYLFTHDSLKESNVKKEIQDELFAPVARYVVENNIASINRVQREFQVGFNRAQKLFDMLEYYGIVSAGQGGKAREVLVSYDKLDDILGDK